MIEVRAPAEEERPQILEVMRVSLNLDRARLERRGPHLDLSQFLVATRGGRVVATAGVRPFRQWFGGRELPMAGIYAVATLPEERGSGVASRLVGEAIRQARTRGFPITGLYPSAVALYRSLGYELAGTLTEHRIDLNDLPALEPALAVEEYTEGDLEGVRACYREVMRHHNGPIDCDDRDWWQRRIIGHDDPGRVGRTVVAKGDDRIQGYAAFEYARAEGELDGSFDIDCRHLVAATPAALEALLAYFRGFRGIGQGLIWPGPPADPALLVLPEQRLKPHWTFRWMLRLLDVPAALEARGYPPVAGTAVVAVDDAIFPENRGPFRIEAGGGRVTVERAEGPAPRPVPVGVLSSLYTGFLRSRDAARLGALDQDDPALPLLAALLEGSPPWMAEFF